MWYWVKRMLGIGKCTFPHTCSGCRHSIMSYKGDQLTKVTCTKGWWR